LELERELERLQRGSTRDHDLESRLHERERDLETQLHERERDLEMQLQEREHEIRELRKAQVIVERSGDDSVDLRYMRKVEDLRAENEELRRELEQRDQLLIVREEENEALADHADRLQLEVEDLQRRREAESIERSESRAQILEEREEREAVEDDLNAIRDKLAAATIELQQKEDELELKNKEIDDLIQEHDRVVDVVEEEWRGEVEEARSQVEELRDVCFIVLSNFCLSPSCRCLQNARMKQGNSASTSQNSKPTLMTSMPSSKPHLRTLSKKQRRKIPSSALQTRRSSTSESKYMHSKKTQTAWPRIMNGRERKMQLSAKH
jgi:hypothetical protein